MEQQLTDGPLLNEKGILSQAGYATKLVKQYSRKDIKASAWRIKEWDYYLVSDGKKAAAFTIADNSYMALISTSFIDLEKPAYTTTSVMKWFTFGKLTLPPSSETGTLEYKDKRVSMKFFNECGKRRIECVFYKFNKKGETFSAAFDLAPPSKDSMVIATPFKGAPLAFYYNQKINCIKAAGSVKIGKNEYLFAESDTLGTLDWGRGVWTYKNTWYWSSLSVYNQGIPLGFNLGYGFGDTSAASENMIFYDGVAHKTGEIQFHIPKKKGEEDFMNPWTVSSNDSRINLTFQPIIDRYDNTNAVILASNQHQVFGNFSGTLVLDPNTTITIKDKPGFAEKVMNKW